MKDEGMAEHKKKKSQGRKDPAGWGGALGDRMVKRDRSKEAFEREAE